MGRRRAEDPERLRGAPEEVGRSADRAVDPAVERLLALQRSAGNTAVARRIAASRPMLARQGDDESESLSADTDSLGGEIGGGEEDAHSPYNPEEAFVTAVRDRAASVGRAREPVAPPPPAHSALRGNVEDRPYDAVGALMHPYDAQEAPDPAVNYALGRGQEVDDETSLSEDLPDVVPAAPPPVVAPPAPARVNYAPGRQGDVDTETSLSEDDLSEDDASVGPGPVPVAPPGGRARSSSFHAYDDAGEGDVLPTAPVAPLRPRSPSLHAYDTSDEGDVVPVAPRRRKKGVVAAIKRVGGRLKKLFKPRHGRDVRAEDLLADDQDVSQREERFAVSSSSFQENRALPLKYFNLASMVGHHGEHTESDKFTSSMLNSPGGLVFDMARFKLIPFGTSPDDLLRDPAKVREGLMKVWGWSAEDVAKYYDPLGKAAKGAKVKYINSAEELATYSVKIGSTLMHGRPRTALDTGAMVSKASGPGWGIFVMDAEGRLFVGQHRVGLFHHSSFLAGRAVAAAGEMKVTGGKLVAITAKSGHYTPSPKQTQQVLQQLAAKGCPLAGVACKVWISDPQVNLKTVLYDADDLMRNGTAAKVLAQGHQLA